MDSWWPVVFASLGPPSVACTCVLFGVVRQLACWVCVQVSPTTPPTNVTFEAVVLHR